MGDLHRGRAGQVRQEQSEFIPTKPVCGIDVSSDGSGQQVGRTDEHMVSSLVTVNIIIFFKVIYIEKEKTKRMFIP